MLLLILTKLIFCIVSDTCSDLPMEESFEPLNLDGQEARLATPPVVAPQRATTSDTCLLHRPITPNTPISQRSTTPNTSIPQRPITPNTPISQTQHPTHLYDKDP